jgi:hypothetical protein
MAIF